MKRKPILLLFLFLWLASCQTIQLEPEYSLAEIKKYTYKTPIELDDGWKTAHPDPQSISLPKLEDGVRAVLRGEYPRIHSILVASGGKLILEEYFAGYTFEGEWKDYDYNTPHGLGSISKSLTSLIFGIAHDQQRIEDLDSSILAWYPKYNQPDRAEKEAVTIRHLLTMQAGLEWNEHAVSYNSRLNDMNRLIRSNNPVEFFLRKKLVQEPGTQFTYNCGCTNLLSYIIYRSTEQYIDEFAQENFFIPLAIKNAQWFVSPHGDIIAGPRIDLLPRDLLKIGELILRNGMWKNKQIISKEWLSDMLYPSVTVDGWDVDYGFQWWLPDIIHPESQKLLQPYMAGGRGGQWLIVYPEQDCVLVITGGNYNSEDESYAWHDDFFLPALRVDND
ncbi:MAG: serine hydrolase [Spirochaetales bacterium]|jgi:CubicO group peptidase (beta-lactamase class C family)|nr:serine hydrolase [Spirochaetales bacterium]